MGHGSLDPAGLRPKEKIPLNFEQLLLVRLETVEMVWTLKFWVMAGKFETLKLVTEGEDASSHV